MEKRFGLEKKKVPVGATLWEQAMAHQLQVAMMTATQAQTASTYVFPFWSVPQTK